MPKRSQVSKQTLDDLAELKNRLAETEETLYAIQQYLVDAFVVNHLDGAQVVTLANADVPYRRMVEAMNEGAVTIIPDGTILYSNPRFCEMVQTECEQIIGIRFHNMLVPGDHAPFDLILQEIGDTGRDGTRGEFSLQAASGECIKVQLSIYELAMDGVHAISIIATDLTERIQAETKIRSLASALTKAEQVERHRISQILHDDLQQRLFAINAQISMLSVDNQNGVTPEMLSVLQRVQDELSDSIAITRSLSIDISPAVLHNEGLADAISWLASQMKEQFHLNIELQTHEEMFRLEDHMRVLLFRAVRELLFNIVKHAHITQAMVNLEPANGNIRITVTDRGSGFDVDAVMANPNNVHGLLIIQDRLSLMGGKMEIISSPGKGTQVIIEAPLETKPA